MVRHEGRSEFVLFYIATSPMSPHLGRSDKSSEPDGDGGDFDEAHEIIEKFVVPRRDAAELFELVEEPFDDVALFVERLVVGVLMLAMAPWRDDRLGACSRMASIRRSAS